MGNWHSNFRDLTKSRKAKKTALLPHTRLLATAERTGPKRRVMKYTLAATTFEQQRSGLQCIIANRGFGVNGNNNPQWPPRLGPCRCTRPTAGCSLGTSTCPNSPAGTFCAQSHLNLAATSSPTPFYGTLADATLQQTGF